eukprot:1853185-Pyramimonas_sp.AAC.1
MADFDCKTRGGFLASVHSAEENYFVASLAGSRFPTIVGRDVWIGASDRQTEGMWEWSDGSPWTYSQWNERQPDNWGGDQHCGIVWASRSTRDGTSPNWDDAE